MESLFANRPLRKRRLIIMVLVSLLLHGSLVGLAAIWPSQKSWNIPPVVTEIDTNPVLGETVQELIAPKEEPVPTPDSQPTPPPEDTPPPDDTPPPSDDPDMSTPPPAKKDKPRSAHTPYPANVKRGDHPQEGVVGGVPHAEKKTGTPGGGWILPKPPYPAQARLSHITGSGAVSITTDGSGQVVSVTIAQSVGSGLLDANTKSFARANWKGPPNSSTTVPITYRLQ